VPHASSDRGDAACAACLIVAATPTTALVPLLSSALIVAFIGIRRKQTDAAGAALPGTSPMCCPVSELLTSSDTSGGECKLIPIVDNEHDRHHRLHSLIGAVVNQLSTKPQSHRSMLL
jgi:hypothetical protein